jgi:hypothetical protein
VLVAAVLVQPPDEGLAPLGGLGLDMAIVGLFVIVRSHIGRIRAKLPPWLPS